MTMPVNRERDRRSLQDLAKMASMAPSPPSVAGSDASLPSGVQRAAEAQKDDSGIVDLAAAAASDPHASERAQKTPLASAGLFDEPVVAQQPAPVVAQQPAPSLPPTPSSVAPAPVAHASVAPASVAPASAPMMAAPTSPETNKGGGKLVAVVFGLVAAAAVAAGGFVLVRGHQEKANVATSDVKPTPAETKVEPKPAPAAVAEATPAPTEGSMDLNALPTATPANAAANAGAKVAAAPAAAKPAKPEGEAKVAQKDIATTPAGPTGLLGDEIRKAVGAKDQAPEAAPAAGPTGPAAGSVPQKPSQGAVTGALGAVLPEARKCLGPDDPISRATVVFGSNGSVQTVNVSGGAAGKPAEGCIKAALTKAKVAPFAETSYSAPVTIRH